MSPVHPSAAIGFGRAAADYERGRPGYPPAAIELLADRLGLWPDNRIVDLGAGTGEPSQDTSRWRERLDATGQFSPLTRGGIPHVVESDRDALLARMSSA